MNFSEMFSQDNVSQVIWPVLVNYVPKILGFLFALLATKILAGWVYRLTFKGLAKADDALRKFMSSMAKYAVLTIGIVTSLGYVGIETASFAAVIAASGLAIGLAFQGTLSNFSAGVMLLIFRPFKVGDYIGAAGKEGFIEAIDLFSTDVRTVDNKRIILPNSAIFGATIINYSHYPVRRVDISVGTDYGADIEETRKVLETVPAAVEGALKDPEPQIFLSGLGASSIDWVVRIWCSTADYWDVHQRTVTTVKQVLDSAGISIPFPQQNIHFDEEFIQSVKKR